MNLPLDKCRFLDLLLDMERADGLFGMVASWLVCLTMDQVLWVPILARDITFFMTTAQILALSVGQLENLLL